jgi:hypothetical protein
LYKNREETAIYKRRNNTQNNKKHRIHKIESKTYKTRQQTKKNTEKNISLVISFEWVDDRVS